MEPTPAINPLVVEVMNEVGVDLSNKKPKSVFELFKQGKLYTHVVPECDQADSRCPVFPGITTRWHWPFPDPAKVVGTDAEQLEQVRKIRDMIKTWMLNPPADSINFEALTNA